MKNLILLAALFFCTLQISYAQKPGDLDPSFGNNGIVRTNSGTAFNYSSTGKQVLIQSNGSMYFILETNGVIVINKKFANGSADIGYGDSGYSAAVNMATAHAAFDANGKIVVAGTVKNADQYIDSRDIGVARFNTDGSLDGTFDGDGIKVFDAGDSDNAVSIAIENDGRIIVGGSFVSYYAEKLFSVLIRFNTNGSVDRYTDSDNEEYTAVAVQSDGKILAAGYNVIVRYNSDLSLDNSFSGDGIQNFYSYVSSIAIQSNGKIIVAGDAVARFNADGSPDNSFADDGIQTSDFRISSMVLQSDGKIIAAGNIINGSTTDFTITRYNTNGTLDNTFDTDGKQFTDFNSSNDYANSIAIKSDGKIVALGYTINATGTYVAASRYNTNGGLDNSFDGDGKLVNSINQGNTSYSSTAIQSDGKLVAAGNTWNGTNWDFAVVRYNTNGSLDNTFSEDGKQITDFTPGDDYAYSVAIQSDGKIVVGGSAGENFAIAGTTQMGAWIILFDGDGKLTTDLGTADNIKKVIIQDDGKILAGGTTLARYNSDGSRDLSLNGYFSPFEDMTLQGDGKILTCKNQTVTRYNTDGSLDNSFGENGVSIEYFDELGSDYRYKSIQVQNDGKIVLGAYMEEDRSARTSILIVRLENDGDEDETFGGYGAVRTPISASSSATSVKIQNDNKIILAGYSFINGADDFTILRYNTDGSLDNTFSDDGIQITQASGANDRISGIAIFGNKLYAAGYGQFPGNFGVVARYLLEGANKAPTVNITSPANNANYAAPANITINATASDADGTITSVKFYNGSTLLKTDSTSPYSYIMSNAAAGTYKFYATAIDNKGLANSSATVTIFVVAGAANKAPVVNITNPVNNATFTPQGSITINATASDPDGTISSVKFYNGATLLKTDSTSPYSYTINSASASSYSFVAKATDNKGLISNSATVTVSSSSTANKAPILNITSPANNATYIAPSTITINATASDPDGSITSVKFYNGSTLLKTDSTNPYSYTMTNAAAGTYKFFATATDNKGLASSTASATVFVVPGAANKAPVVNLISPTNNATYTSPATITLNATASDADGNITVVKFYNGGALLKTDSTSPYSHTITNAVAGKYSFVAKATDNKGLISNSATVAVSVATGTNTAPTVSIINPANQEEFTALATINLEAAAQDADGSISKVDFYNGSTLLITERKAPYTYQWLNVPAGTYVITAVATDNTGAATTSAVVNITVTTNKAPTVSIINPANQEEFTAPATINLEAAAQDADGSISKVDFYNGSTLLITERKAPYTYQWQNVPAGTYTLTAIATDNLGRKTTSSPITVTVSLGAQMVSSKPSFNNSKVDMNAGVTLKLSPNPARDILNISTTGLQLNKPTTISVISSSGVVFKTIRTASADQTTQLNVSSLVSGVYTLKVINGDKVIYKRFVKM